MSEELLTHKELEAQAANPEPEEVETEETSEAPKVDDEVKSEESEENPEATAEGDEDDAEKKPQNRVQKRISKLTKEKYDLRSENEILRQELEAMKAPHKEDQSQKQEAQAEDTRPTKPSEDDFEDYDEYENALDEYQEKLTDWKVDQKLKARDQKERETKEQEQAQKSVADTRKKFDEFVEKTEDFNEVVESVSHIEISDQALAQAIVKSGPEVYYELCKNPEVLEDLSMLSGYDALKGLREFKKSIATSEPSTEPKIKTSRAPEPLGNVGGQGSKTAKKPLDQVDFQEYNRRRAAGET